MKKINLDIILKIFILIAFSIFYLKIILTNEIKQYVNPRFIPFTIFAMVAMFLISLFLVKDSFNSKKKKLKLKNYIIFLIPLVMIFFMQSTTTKSITNEASSKTESDSSENDKIDIEDNIIKVSPRNFVSSLNEIYNNTDEYNGDEIELSGFVYKDKTLKGNEFIIGRYMMVCCAADMQVVGFTCDNNNNLQSFENNTWIIIKGKIKKSTSGSDSSPIVELEKIEKDPNPDASYVYPF